uniref:Glycerate kinase n=1 Tax=Acrobeloides nanus TaxID=290746 RepID=A0A914DTQ8_9BILA
MVVGAEEQLGRHVIRGIASVPVGTSIKQKLKTEFYEGAENNLPDYKAMETAEKIEKFLGEIVSPNDIVLFLISGGGSALLPAPVHGITLEEKLQVIRLMSTRGADIKQLNTVRIALSRLKGGQLGLKAAPAKAISLIMSDIIGDPLNLIASGPTVRCEESLENPIDILKQLDLLNEIPPYVLEYLKNQSPESLTDSKVEITNVVVGNNQFMLRTLADSFANSGIQSIVATEPVEGDATQVASKYVDFMLGASKLSSSKTSIGGLDSEFSTVHSPTIFIFGGETTVNFPRDINLSVAKGGRNQEMVLAFLKKLLELYKSEKKIPAAKLHFAFFSLGTDGQDGPTDATGALITSEDVPSSSEEIDVVLHEVDSSLKSKNSYGYWSKFNDGANHVKIGKTGNNLMDVQLLYVYV